ncbi:cupin domain-containing protein [Hyphobacterium sp.]|uniref:cupin domain-containing protein n=1 Tax=Hyphobacterium sp. TaxID=2004662 RepID=UPI003BAB8C42
MNTRLKDEWVLDHASGAAPRAVRVLVDSAAEINPEIRAQLDVAERIGASLAMADLWSTTPAAPEVEDAIIVETDQNPGDPLYPAALSGLGFRQNLSPWRSRLGGVRSRKVNRLCESGIDARLFEIQPGASIPDHDHGDQELTLVLQGGFRDSNGIYHRGDVCVGEANEAHNPVGLDGEPCICFSVAIGGYKFRNPLISIAASFLK